MDSELKRIIELENQILELKEARDKELMKAQIINNIIEKASEQQGLDIKKINIPFSTDPSQTKE
jgi:hypothetical protein